MKYFSLVLVFVALLSCKPKSDPLSESTLALLETAEKNMFNATSSGDSAAFRKLTGRDYFTINANGKSQTLNEALKLIHRFKGSAVELSQQQQRVYGNMALRTGLGKVYINGDLVAEMLYTSGWVFRDGKWEFIHWQGTPTGILLEGKGMLEPPK